MNDRKALIVGINDYPNNELSCCENDAISLEEPLKTNEDDTPNFDTQLLTGTVTRSQLRSSIKQLFEGNSDCALFYFSGHGYCDQAGGYVVTSDYCDDDFGIYMHEILSIATNSKCKNRIIILDCCHSGIFGSIDDKDSTLIQNGMTIITACRKEESSVEYSGIGHGIFTSILLDGLKGGASDIMGHVTPGSLYSYIDKSLGPWDQRPIFRTNVSSFISLRENTPRIDRKSLKNTLSYFNNEDECYKLDPSFEFTNDPQYNYVLKKPYATSQNIMIFKNLQKLESIGLVVPVDEQHMYFAAMNSKSCKLTPVGKYYYRLFKEGKL